MTYVSSTGIMDYAEMDTEHTRFYSLTLELDGLPKTTNTQAGRGWYARHAEAKKWKEAVRFAIGSHQPDKPLKRAILTLTRFSSSCPDYDGLVSSFKHVIDGLIVSQVIEDDNMGIIGMPMFLWKKAKRGAGFIRVHVIEDVLA